MLPSTPPAPRMVRLAAAGVAHLDEEPAGRHRGASEAGTVSVSSLLAAAGTTDTGRRARRRAAEEPAVVPEQAGVRALAPVVVPERVAARVVAPEAVAVPRQAPGPGAEAGEDATTETMRRGAFRGLRARTDDEAAVTELVARPGEAGRGVVPAVLGLLVGALALVTAVALAVAPSLGLASLTDSTAGVAAVLGAALVGGGCGVVGLAPKRRARAVALLGLVAAGLAVLMVLLPVLALRVL